MAYTAKLAADICERLASGETLREICQTEGFPSERVVRGWAIDDLHGFAAHYTRARDIGLDCQNDRIVEFARLEPDINRARLIVDTLKWRLGKMAPKRYGDRLELAGDKANPIAVDSTLTVRFVDAKEGE